jgi:outer membrane protein W
LFRDIPKVKIQVEKILNYFINKRGLLMKKIISFALVLLFLVSNFLTAQVSSSVNNSLMPLKGKHSISLSFGMLNQQEATVYTVNVKAESNLIGALYYNYWFSDEWALELNAGILNAEVFSGVSLIGIEQKAATVVPLLAGARFYPELIALAENVRPYVIALVGVHMGHSSSNKVTLGLVTATETKVQSVFASKFGIGIDAFVGNWVRLGLGLGYNLGADFEEPVGTRVNYSGIDLALSFGIIL